MFLYCFPLCSDSKNSFHYNNKIILPTKSNRIFQNERKQFLCMLLTNISIQGFEEMIHSRTKLIFILLPGIKEYVKQHSRNDDSCRLMQRAIEVSFFKQTSQCLLFWCCLVSRMRFFMLHLCFELRTFRMKRKNSETYLLLLQPFQCSNFSFPSQ